MADSLLLQLVSPERSLVEEQVVDVQIPALDGFIGVLPGHAPLISELKAGGVLSYRLASGGEKFFAIYGGFVEVLPDRVRVLADDAQPRDEIDLTKAREELNQALNAMQNLHAESIDPEVAVASAMRAQAKVDAATAAKS
jgi:F-type H+-transporting ATPase subunit epsilon